MKEKKKSTRYRIQKSMHPRWAYRHIVRCRNVYDCSLNLQVVKSTAVKKFQALFSAFLAQSPKIHHVASLRRDLPFSALAAVHLLAFWRKIHDVN
jgi:hypothetical protein